MLGHQDAVGNRLYVKLLHIIPTYINNNSFAFGSGFVQFHGIFRNIRMVFIHPILFHGKYIFLLFLFLWLLSINAIHKHYGSMQLTLWSINFGVAVSKIASVHV